MSGSSVLIANNDNSAVGVINDVSNTLAVTGGTSGGLGIPAVILQGAGPASSLALGDLALVNIQSAGTSVTTMADTAIYN